MPSWPRRSDAPDRFGRSSPTRACSTTSSAGAGKAPDEVTSQDVFAWAYGTGLSGKQPGSITIGARIACLSSFYRFLIRMKVVGSNPCDALERPKVTAGAARGLSGEQIHRLLDLVPATPVGLRDRAIILTLVFTGRRRAEVLGMTAGSISVEGEVVFYSYRGKGGKTGKRELPRPAFEAVLTWLESVGKNLATTAAGRIAVAGHASHGHGITSGTFYTNLRCYLKQAGLPPGGVHIFRHSAAKLQSRCRGVGRRRVAVPRSQQFGCDDDLPQASRGAGGPQLDEGSRGDRGLGPASHSRRQPTPSDSCSIFSSHSPF